MGRDTLFSRAAQAIRVSGRGAGLRDKLAIARSYVGTRQGRPTHARVRIEDRAFPVTLRSGADRTVMFEMLCLDEYRAAERPEPAVILDVGANVGFSSLYFAARFPGAVIHAVEAAPATFGQLVENTAGVTNIRTHHMAIGAEDGEAEFWLAPMHFGSSLRKREGATAVKVPMRTLDGFLDQQGIGRVGLMKFDIEGAEVELFRGLSDPGRIAQAIGEVHYDLIDQGPAWFRERLAGFAVEERPSGNHRTILHAKRAA